MAHQFHAGMTVRVNLPTSERHGAIGRICYATAPFGSWLIEFAADPDPSSPPIVDGKHLEPWPSTDHTHDLAPGVQEAINAAASCCCNRPETATCPAPELTDGEAPTIRKSELRMALTDIDKSLNAARVGLLCDPPETKSPLALLTVIQDQIDSWLRGLGR